MTASASAIAAATPQIEAAVSPCVMCEGLVCASACPRGALKPADPGAMRIALASRNSNACWAEAGTDPGCDQCYQRCPLRGRAITWRAGRGPKIDPAACTGCGSCLWACPAQPNAISLTPC
jgi:Fe-S-cluster-containing dehydrogenase component